MRKITTIFSTVTLVLALAIVGNSSVSAASSYSTDTTLYNIVKKKDINDLKLDIKNKVLKLADTCLKDGKTAAKELNALKSNRTDFEIGLRKVLDKYYSQPKVNRAELDYFEAEIDDKANEILTHYEEAEAERDNQDNLKYKTAQVLVSFPYGTPMETIEAVVANEAISYRMVDNGEYDIADDLPEDTKKRLEFLKDKKGDIIIWAEATLEDTVERTIEKFESYDCVKSATCNVIFESDGVISNESISVSANDKYFNETDQWNLKYVDIAKAWNRFAKIDPANLHEVRVAVIDCGVQMNHPDLKNVLMPKYSVDVTTDPYTKLLDLPDTASPHGQYTSKHGTRVACIIMAEGNNGIGISGIASIASRPELRSKFKLMAIKCDNDGSSNDRHITQEYLYKAVKHAVAKGADVINISYSQTKSEFKEAKTLADLESAIKDAIEAGVCVVCSVGNDGKKETATTPRYPAAFEGVIGVGATYRNGSLAAYTNRAANVVDIVAPGGYEETGGYRVLSTVPGGYSASYGTSFATPHVTATIAMMKSINDKLTPGGYLYRLKNRGNTSTKHPYIELDTGEAVRLMDLH